MKITIIGVGGMAKGIATRVLAGGHSVTFHAKDMNKGQALMNELKNSIDGKSTVDVVDVGSSVEDLVILAIPYTEMSNIAEAYDGFVGKTVVDITNPVDFNTFQLIPKTGTSGAEEVSKLIPEAKVLKAFNTTFAGTLIAGKVDGKLLDVFVAGDDQAAKDRLSMLVGDGGMRAVDVGPLSQARHLEGFQLLHMSVQEQIGGQWMSAIKILS